MIGKELGGLVGLPWDSRGADLARRLLGEIAAGRTVPGKLLAELAACVLEQRPIVLAQEVRAGGPHRLRAAIELAALLLTVEAAPVQEGCAQSGSGP
jgi:hypothetical protein